MVFFVIVCTLQNISDDKFEQLFNALPENEHLEVLSLTNVGLTDRTALQLAEVIQKNKTLRVLNVETNFISPAVIVTLVRALLKVKSIEEFRATNQVSGCLPPFIDRFIWLRFLLLSCVVWFFFSLIDFGRDPLCWETKSKWKSPIWWNKIRLY